MKRPASMMPVVAVAAALTLAACASGPDYRKPALDLPAAWTPEAPWRSMQPQDAVARGPWWERFGDAQLNALQQQALAGNQTLAIATARLAQARAQLNVAGAAQAPQVGLSTRAGRGRISANRPLTNYNAPNYATVQNDFALGLNVSYEMDFFGRVQRSVEAAGASAQQSAADLENTRLLLTAELASNYFNLRELDIELDVVQRAIALQRKALELATSRHDLGATSGLDVAQQQALLDNTLTQVDVLGRQRAQYEHAIATLIGVSASSFSLPQMPLNPTLPSIPMGVPSQLLERRPDIAGAERRTQAANAQIGIAISAYYPNVTLSGAGGFASSQAGTWIQGPSALWSLGGSAVELLFDAGRRHAITDQARDAYEAQTANYRQSVLNAFQEVEDNLAALRILNDEAATQNAAVQASIRSLNLSTSRYKGGVTTYLEVLTAQTTQLSNQRTQADITTRQFAASVQLIKALGGGWDTSQLPQM